MDAPHAVIVLAHRLSLRFCMDLLQFRPNECVWFLITRTFEPVVMIFGCNST